MNRPGLRLPSRVTLPAAPLMAGWYVRDALRVSKQVVSLWRKNHASGLSSRRPRILHVDRRDCRMA